MSESKQTKHARQALENATMRLEWARESMAKAQRRLDAASAEIEQYRYELQLNQIADEGQVCRTATEDTKP